MPQPAAHRFSPPSDAPAAPTARAMLLAVQAKPLIQWHQRGRHRRAADVYMQVTQDAAQALALQRGVAVRDYLASQKLPPDACFLAGPKWCKPTRPGSRRQS